LAEDTGEKHNLAEKLPEKADELQKRLAAWRKDENIFDTSRFFESCGFWCCFTGRAKLHGQ
jgi:hypothetical protein